MWSPQRYLKEGKSKGIPESVLHEAIEQIQRVGSRTPPAPPILSLAHLARRTEISTSILRKYVTRSGGDSYRHFFVKKRTGGYWRISVPLDELHTAQSWIAQNILRANRSHPASHAFCKDDSIVKCASVHRNSKWLIKIDIADFFGSITEIQVYRAFRRLEYNPLISFEMARICTEQLHTSEKYKFKSWQVQDKAYTIPGYQRGLLGRLPQGAPTSPMLSNLVMLDIDDTIDGLARERGLRYTRYSDDMAFSTDGVYDRTKAVAFIQEVSLILKKHGLFLNRGKTRIVPPGAKKVVLGLLVDGFLPNLTKEFKDKIRQHLYYIKKFGIENHVVQREFDSVGGLYRHLGGLIDFANMVDASYADKVRVEFKALPWPGF